MIHKTYGLLTRLCMKIIINVVSLFGPGVREDSPQCEKAWWRRGFQKVKMKEKKKKEKKKYDIIIRMMKIAPITRGKKSLFLITTIIQERFISSKKQRYVFTLKLQQESVKLAIFFFFLFFFFSNVVNDQHLLLCNGSCQNGQRQLNISSICIYLFLLFRLAIMQHKGNRCLVSPPTITKKEFIYIFAIPDFEFPLFGRSNCIWSCVALGKQAPLTMNCVLGRKWENE